MRLTRTQERKYVRKNLREVRHITLNPKEPGVVRVHMIPPKTVWDRRAPYLLILNGQYLLPIGISWAIMLDCLIRRLEPTDGQVVEKADWTTLIWDAVNDTAKVYPAMKPTDVRKEMDRLIRMLETVAVGKKPNGKIKPLSFADYAPQMTAPHRMDLMISAMTRDGCWHCNQKCLHCYAAGQEGAEVPELSTGEWKKIIDACRKANIPQLTFTGGEPTLRDDLTELVAYSKWFVTRLNTNGRKLTPELCKDLYEASLDSVQITLYSSDPGIHNQLVGAQGFEDTVEGIRNALAAGLNASVNTPLCKLNGNYTDTLKFLDGLGIRYVTCSGLIPSGNALNEGSVATALTKKELKKTLTDAVAYCNAHGMEISFTSPGRLSPKTLTALGLTEIPSCGACLSNMAVRPDGGVIPCQSWLSEETLGNLLRDPWKKIWESKRCAGIREISAKTEYNCQLRAKNTSKKTKPGEEDEADENETAEAE